MWQKYHICHDPIFVGSSVVNNNNRLFIAPHLVRVQRTYKDTNKDMFISSHTHTHTHAHTHTHTVTHSSLSLATHTHTQPIHALLVMGWYKKKMTDQYAEEMSHHEPPRSSNLKQKCTSFECLNIYRTIK